MQARSFPFLAWSTHLDYNKHFKGSTEEKNIDSVESHWIKSNATCFITNIRNDAFEVRHDCFTVWLSIRSKTISIKCGNNRSKGGIF